MVSQDGTFKKVSILLTWEWVNQCCYILDVSAKVDGSGPAGCSGRDTLGHVYNYLVADTAVVEKADHGGG